MQSRLGHVDMPSAIPSKRAQITTQERQPTSEALRRRHTDELVLALSGPVGSGHREVSAEFKNLLETIFGYEVSILKLSDYIRNESDVVIPDDEFHRIKILQSEGNRIRKEQGNDYLAAKAIEYISVQRERYRKDEGHENYESRRICYIVDSIKNMEEYRALRLVYEEMFYLFGVFSPLPDRVSTLEDRGITTAQVYDIIDRDSGEELEHGQQVRDTFVESDFFIRVDTKIRIILSSQLERYLHLIFGNRIITPTIHEKSMYHAWAAAANSACLSRKVGAALTDSKGNLVSVGWNDVPRFGGDLYHNTVDRVEADPDDRRCYNHGGKCYNDEEIVPLATEMFEKQKDKKLLTTSSFLKVIDTVRETKIRGLIEFSRSIHAEMHSILSAAHSEGHRIRDGKLYVTTYPCHSCARHIICAGISEVYYVEPYRKSLAVRLHGDAISEVESETKKVRILPYSGVSPRIYLQLFTGSASHRKSSDGLLVTVNQLGARPLRRESLEGFPTRESIVVRTGAAASVGGGGDEHGPTE